MRARVGIGVVALVPGVVLAWGLTSSAPVTGAAAVADNTVSGGYVVRLLRSFYDADADGYPSGFCEFACDCNDGNADINPGAFETPDNGVDEDCDGRDLVKSTPVVVRAVEKDPELPGAEGQHATPKPKAKGIESRSYNVLWIVLDTVRADHMNLYGYKFPTTIQIDAFAKSARVFEQARSQGPNTRGSMPSMLTGRYYTETHRDDAKWVTVFPENVMAAEIFQAAGYQTHGISSFGYFGRSYGYAQGFDEFDTSIIRLRRNVYTNPTSDLVTDHTLAWLDGRQKDAAPFFLLTHYADPHVGYVAHETGGALKGSRHLRYDGEIWFVDQHVGRLLRGIKSRGLMENTLVVITSDHGEGLSEKEDHGFRYHGQHIYDNAVHVPLVFYAPGVVSGRTKTPVGCIDILPTLLELTGVKSTGPSMSGVSLLAFLDGKKQAHAPVVIEKGMPPAFARAAMLDWPYKVIWRLAFNQWELYNIERDPNERTNLKKTEADVLERLKKQLKMWRSTELEYIKPQKK